MISQFCIFLFGIGGIWLANDPRPKVRRFGCVSGLIAQPFWYYAAFTNHQWGIFGASFFYTWSWARGFYYQWMRPNAVR